MQCIKLQQAVCTAVMISGASQRLLVICNVCTPHVGSTLRHLTYPSAAVDTLDAPLQVWMGACLLSDLILSHQQLFCGQTIVELGAGVGLVSIVAALFAKHVLLTDADEGALQLASRNAADNAKLLSQEQRRPSQHTLQQPGRQHTAQSPADSRVNGRITIRGLNWLQLFGTQLGSLRFDEVLQLMNGRGFSIHSELASPAEAAAKSNKQQTTMSADSAQHQQVAPNKQQEQVLLQRSMWQQRFQWQGGDLAVLAAANIWLAADVIYNETLTDAFVRTAHQLMTWQCKQQQQQQQLREATAVGITCSSAHLAVAGTQNQPRSPRLFVAVEKRYNFTLRDLDARASAFDHFMTYVKAMDSRPDREQPSEKVREPQPVQDGAAAGHGEIANGKTLFWGTRWQVEDIPQVCRGAGTYMGVCCVDLYLCRTRSRPSGREGMHLLGTPMQGYGRSVCNDQSLTASMSVCTFSHHCIGGGCQQMTNQ